MENAIGIDRVVCLDPFEGGHDVGRLTRQQPRPALTDQAYPREYCWTGLIESQLFVFFYYLVGYAVVLGIALSGCNLQISHDEGFIIHRITEDSLRL